MHSSDSQSQKKHIRAHLRHSRRLLSAHDQRRASEKVARRVASLQSFKRAKYIALYIANDGELSPSPLMKLAWQQGKTCLLPRVIGNTMSFHIFKRGDKLKRNRFGILEPLQYTQFFKPKDIDLICVPLVAFDSKGRRLGMGGGFYDRCFAFMQRSYGKKPVLLGLAHSLQKVDCLPMETWDIALDGIISDIELIKPQR